MSLSRESYLIVIKPVMATAAGAALAITACLLLTQPAAAYEHRLSTPSVGGQLQIGDLEYDSEWGDLFAWGRGGTVQLRQYIARNRALGISFELQKFNRESGVPATDPAFKPDFWQAQILLVDYYFYFHRPRKRCEYIVLGAGFYRPEIVDEEKVVGGGNTVQVVHPGENFLGRVGLGMEYFVARTFSIDGSVSGYYFHAPDADGLTASVQFALGVHLYAGK